MSTHYAGLLIGGHGLPFLMLAYMFLWGLRGGGVDNPPPALKNPPQKIICIILHPLLLLRGLFSSDLFSTVFFLFSTGLYFFCSPPRKRRRRCILCNKRTLNTKVRSFLVPLLQFFLLHKQFCLCNKKTYHKSQNGPKARFLKQF